MSDRVEVPITVLRQWRDTVGSLAYASDSIRTSRELGGHDLKVEALSDDINSYIPRDPVPVVPVPERWSITCECGKRQQWEAPTTCDDFDLYRRRDLGPLRPSLRVCQGCGARLAVQPLPEEVTG